MANQTNPNYEETPQGWVKKDQSQAKGVPIDWDRAERLRRWAEEVVRERNERNERAKNERP